MIDNYLRGWGHNVFLVDQCAPPLVALPPPFLERVYDKWSRELPNVNCCFANHGPDRLFFSFLFVRFSLQWELFVVTFNFLNY